MTVQPEVQDQYEAYPYPSRNPTDEHKRLITGSPSNLAELNHYLFAGKRDFSKSFRALVAGGGTGDATIMLAQQLANASKDGKGQAGQVTYLDLSSASRAIVEARAKARDLNNITFLSGSLLDLPSLGLEPFDYIDCCGVLHHLTSPEQGLEALASVLKEDGGMGIMVYGQYGREGVYPMQDLLRSLGKECSSLAEKVKLARRLLEKLPPTNSFNRNPFVIDHKASDAELVDLLLHSCDRAYTVPQVADLVASSGLELTAFVEPIRYKIDTYVKDAKLLQHGHALNSIEQAAVAEKLASNMKLHVFYLSRKKNTIADLSQAEKAIPVFREMQPDVIAESLKKVSTLKSNLDGIPLNLPLPRLSAAIAKRCNGRNNLSEIFAELKELDARLEWDKFLQQFKEFYIVFNDLNHLLLRYEDN
ncbi:bifunctional 2-polyprenyl-6-hydroxyphenol methylase/3-demethylubiquinol 3-O-methyltransferase UbiG [Kiloniella sp. EL199]|uniref:class I SAM-dependent methyltransferase n=1 Tax=Kiloniella sp. EL199 TaxID=2107581 RepID=UPI000EA228AE|nr:class I SAM-dependent methyltransferase [Kiloniella sp. EL199]